MRQETWIASDSGLTKSEPLNIVKNRLVARQTKNCVALAMALIRRDVRAVEGGSLENCWGASPRGFESLSLRSFLVPERLFLVYVLLWRGARAVESGSLLRS